jgi:hypothetical protein
VLALELTGFVADHAVYTANRPKDRQGRNGDADHGIPLRVRLYIKEYTLDVSVSVNSELCSPCPRKIPQTGEQPTQTRVLPQSPATLKQV